MCNNKHTILIFFFFRKTAPPTVLTAKLQFCVDTCLCFKIKHAHACLACYSLVMPQHLCLLTRVISKKKKKLLCLRKSVLENLTGIFNAIYGDRKKELSATLDQPYCRHWNTFKNCSRQLHCWDTLLITQFVNVKKTRHVTQT